MPKPPSRRASAADITRFLDTSRAIGEQVARQPRLLFAIDATASRQPTWDSASHLQREMFLAVGAAGGLAVQLCYYRGFRDFHASGWLTDSAALARQMAQVRCEGGHTQIERLLHHALGEHRAAPVKALVFIGDALEESADTLCDLAGRCGIVGLPLFLFQEGRQQPVEQCFRAMARLSGGAWARFDGRSARTLAELLGAVARYAAGGRDALAALGGEGATLLLQQLRS